MQLLSISSFLFRTMIYNKEESILIHIRTHFVH
jgi:hypothetical protein